MYEQPPPPAVAAQYYEKDGEARAIHWPRYVMLTEVGMDGRDAVSQRVARNVAGHTASAVLYNGELYRRALPLTVLAEALLEGQRAQRLIARRPQQSGKTKKTADSGVVVGDDLTDKELKAALEWMPEAVQDMLGSAIAGTIDLSDPALMASWCIWIADSWSHGSTPTRAAPARILMANAFMASVYEFIITEHPDPASAAGRYASTGLEATGSVAGRLYAEAWSLFITARAAQRAIVYSSDYRFAMAVAVPFSGARSTLWRAGRVYEGQCVDTPFRTASRRFDPSVEVGVSRDLASALGVVDSGGGRSLNTGSYGDDVLIQTARYPHYSTMRIRRTITVSTAEEEAEVDETFVSHRSLSGIIPECLLTAYEFWIRRPAKHNGEATHIYMARCADALPTLVGYPRHESPKLAHLSEAERESTVASGVAFNSLAYAEGQLLQVHTAPDGTLRVLSPESPLESRKQAEDAARLAAGLPASAKLQPAVRLRLVNVTAAPCSTAAGQVMKVFSHVETASHMLVWAREFTVLAGAAQQRGAAASGATGTPPASVLLLDSVLLPRLQLRFNTTIVNGQLAIASVDHAGMMLPPGTIPEFAFQAWSTFPHALPLCTLDKWQWAFVAPTFTVRRPSVSSQPFSTFLIPMRDDTWGARGGRTVCYPLHASRTYMTPPSPVAALQLFACSLMRRQYDVAASLLHLIRGIELHAAMLAAWCRALISSVGPPEAQRCNSDASPDAIGLMLRFREFTRLLTLLARAAGAVVSSDRHDLFLTTACRSADLRRALPARGA